MMTSRQAKAAGNARPGTTAKRALRVAGIAAAVLGLAAAFACSSSKSGSGGGTPCNENPWECASGQVCWPTTNSAFACLPSGTAQAGDACMLTIGAATCSDGLNCLATSASGEGVCSPYCDPTGTSHGCAAPTECASASLPGVGSGADFNVCVAPSEEGGSEGGASETDASDAGVSLSDAGTSDVSASDVTASDVSASDAHTSEAGASDASADVVVGE